MAILGLSIGQGIALLSVLGVLYVAKNIVYNLYFHPLAKFPGPRFAAISNIWYATSWMGGRYPHEVAAAHEKYGPVVRIAPGELSFSSVGTYKEIYGHATKDRKPFIKSTWYQIEGMMAGVANERDPARHQEMRKQLSHAFSTKALRLQQDVVIQYTDLFVKQMGKYATKDGIRLEEWLNWLTFDIIGDLAFGEPFGAVREAKTSFWISVVVDGIFANSIRELMGRVPIAKLLAPLVAYKYAHLIRSSKAFFALSREKLKTRLAQDNDRDDFFGHILSEKGSHITDDYLLTQAQTLIVAGSETTATLLSSCNYWLLTNPRALSRLIDEVRSTFTQTADITAESTAPAQMPYLFAVLEESLRIHSSAPFGLPRICPGAEIDGNYIPAGTIVHTSSWNTHHDPKYWHDPWGFHPERWLPAGHQWAEEEKFKGDLKEANKPFSVGPRACLGVNLAYMEMRMILTKLVWHFDLELVNKELDWNRDAMLNTVWKKPALVVRATPVVRE